MDGIGIVINLHLIPRRISPKEWREVYQESLKLVEAYDFMDRIEARRNGLRYFFARKSKDRPLFLNRECPGWLRIFMHTCLTRGQGGRGKIGERRFC